MGLFDSIMGRSKPPKPNLDQLFGIPSAAITLEASLGARPTGQGSVAFRAPEGKAFADVVRDVETLLTATSNPDLQVSQDSFGYTWLTIHATEITDVVNGLHAVNVSIQDAGFGPQLLCSLVGFRRDEQTFALVYLYKRGTFYPFAPVAEPRRDNILELQLRDLLADDLAVESDMTRWFPVWGAPGL
jgi:PspA associated protein B